MATKPEEQAKGLSKAGLRAWGEALIKTGTEHLDLSMVRNGRKVLKDAEAATAAKLAADKPPAK